MTNRFSLSIYNYENVSDFLKDTFAELKKSRPSYSVRSWARHLNAGHATSLARILAGERRIPKKMVLAICAALELTPNEAAYFELLAIGKDRFTDLSFQLLKEAVQKNR